MAPIGPIALFGSGETAPSAHRIHQRVMKRLHAPVRVAIIETPAGFEPNSHGVAAAVGRYLEHRLQNFRPQIEIVPARKRNTEYSPDDPLIAAPILQADYLFMGPGSPSYAVRQLHNSVTWHNMLARHRLGAAICFSSATTIALSRFALPVYEIYKVGEEPHWKPGLDFFGSFGLSLVVIPHWNNHDGGEELDTSHCYMGEGRYRALAAMLPADVTILGIDENTGVVILPEEGACEITGPGGAVIVRNGVEERLQSRQTFAATLLGDWRLPEPAAGIPAQVWAAALHAQEQRGAQPVDALPTAALPTAAPPEVAALAQERENARQQRDWNAADRLRDQVLALGWSIVDTREGPRLSPVEPQDQE